ncbi:hypothetical protein [Halomarina pelagica]|uniref:hypothetical protein n=1 Tax=Halomarina pelagica TaxID=2961599 RepID=UPI0020C5A114|nr:hypothetical protein [Halomarina sp. BND7]
MSKRPYRLLETEREFIETGEVPEASSYKPSMLEKRVQEKIDLLPHRIETLREDVELLDQAGYLDVETWTEGWLELLELDEQDSDRDFLSAFEFSYTENGVHGSNPAKVGYQLGRMTKRLLALQPHRIDQRDTHADVIWGFVVGLALEYTTLDEHESTKADILARLQKRADEDTARRQELDEALQAGVSPPLSITRPTEKTREILQNAGVESSDQLVREINRAIAKEHGMDEAWELGLSAEHTVEELLTPQTVLRALRENKLLERRELGSILKADAERLADKGGTPSALDVFKEVRDNEGSSSREIAEGLNQYHDWTSNVTRVAEDLAATADETDRIREFEIWKDRPLLHGDKYEGWKLTAYGRALGCYLKSHNTTVGEITPLWQIPEDVIEVAIDELELSAGI